MSSISLFSSFFQKKAKPRQGWKLLGLGLGAAALWALSALGPFQPTSPALEASVFNGGGSFPQESGADTSQTLTAEEARVVPLGTAFGIKLFTDGVIVVSLSQISTGEGPRCPAEEAGLRPGDLPAGGRRHGHPEQHPPWRPISAGARGSPSASPSGGGIRSPRPR